MSDVGPIIAIDGPAGSGKSTLGRSLAIALGLPYVNTGLMYRALTANVLEAQIDTDDAEAIEAALRGMDFSLTSAVPPELLIDGAPAGPALQAQAVEGSVSEVSRHRTVRATMAAAQRALGRTGAVMEGRDIATVIFPDADLKVFLEADPGVRAERRATERDAAADDLAEALASRDAKDAETNPFVPPADAVVVDTSGHNADEVLQMVLALVRERIG